MWGQLDHIAMQQSTKICLANRNIEVMDTVMNRLSRNLSAVCAQVKTLYLSNNFIASIEHIGQFPCL